MLLQPFIQFFTAFFGETVSYDLIYIFGLCFVYFICFIFADKIINLLVPDTKLARWWLWFISGLVFLFYCLSYLNLLPLGLNLGGSL